MTRRMQIDRLDLDVRGIPPATAEAAARLLGPALAQALRPGRGAALPAQRIDAGRVETAPASGPQALATQMAGHIVQHLAGKRS